MSGPGGPGLPVGARGPGGLSGLAATRALAALALVRAARGKALWIALALALLPVIVVSVRVGLDHDRADVWRAAFELSLLTLPIVPAILIGPSLADELEDRTSAYLWSRALPRWSIVVGKLVGLAPVAAVCLTVGLATSWLVAGGPGAVAVADAWRGLGALAAATPWPPPWSGSCSSTRRWARCRSRCSTARSGSAPAPSPASGPTR